MIRFKYYYKLIFWYIIFVIKFLLLKKQNLINKNILIFTASSLKNSTYTHHLRDLIIGIYLKLLGAKVYIYYDDEHLKNDGVFEDYNEKKGIKITNIINNFFISVLIKIFSINKLTTSILFKNKNHLDKKIFEELQNIKSLDIRNHYESSYRRKYRGFEPEYYEKYNDFSFEERKILYNTALIKIISNNIFNIYNIDTLITTHGIYSLWGPAVDLAIKRNIKVSIYYAHWSKDDKIFIEKDRGYYELNRDSWNEYKINVKKYYSSELKLFQDILERKYFNEKKSNNLNLIKKKSFNFKKVIGIFPSFLHDYAINERNKLFKSPIKWIENMLKICIHNNYLLLIREHPENKEYYDEKTNLLNILKDKEIDVENIDNIIFINGVSEISSYDIISKITDLNVVYDGTLALEIPYMGFPVILAANSKYENKGFTYEYKDIKDYENLILNVNKENHKINRLSFRENALEELFYELKYNGYYFPFRVSLDEMKKRKHKNFYSLKAKDINFNVNKKLLKTLIKIS